MQTFQIEGFFETFEEDPIGGGDISLSFGTSLLQIITSGPDASFAYLAEDADDNDLPFFVPWTIEGRVGSVLLNEQPLPPDVEVTFGRVTLADGTAIDVLAFFSQTAAPGADGIEHIFFLNPPGLPLPANAAEFEALREQVVGLGEITSGPFTPATEIAFADHFTQVATPAGAAALAGLNAATDTAAMDAALRAALDGTAALDAYTALAPALQAQVAADLLLNRPGTAVLSFEGTQVFTEGSLPFATPDGTAIQGLAPVMLPLFGPWADNQLIGIPEPEAAVFVDLPDFGLMALIGAAGPVFEFEGQVSIRAELFEDTLDEDFLREAIGDAYDPLADAGTFDGLVPGEYQLFQVIVSAAVATQDPITGEFLGLTGPELVVNVLTPQGMGLEALLVDLPADVIVLADFEQLQDDDPVGSAFFAIDRLTLGNTDWNEGFASVAEAGALLGGLAGFRAALDTVLQGIADGDLTVEALAALRDATSALPGETYPSGALIPPVAFDRAGAFFAAPAGTQASGLDDIIASGASSFSELIQVLGDVGETLDAGELPLGVFVTDRAGSALEGVTVSVDTPQGPQQGATDADGLVSFTVASEIAANVDASLAYDAAAHGAVTVSSALSILRIALGLNASSGASPTALDYIAADFDGNGAVEVADALGALRAALSLPGAPTPNWVFLDADNPDLGDIDRFNVFYDTGVTVPLDFDPAAVTLTGVLVGDMSGFV